MKVDEKSMKVYAVTDSMWLNGRALADDVERAIQGGATFIQLREKQLNDEAFLAEAIALKKITDRYQVPFVINDNVEIAIKMNADGVHVGQSDMEAGDVRGRLGADKIIGVSVRNLEQALLAQAHGADYLGVGAMFATSTKTDAAEVSFETLREICNAVDIPVVAIGGISLANVGELAGSGIDGVAVVSAIFAQPDIMSATKALSNKMDEVLK